MKKIIVSFFMLLLLISCGESNNKIQNTDENTEENTKIEQYIVGGKQNNYINIYGNILNNNTKDLTSNINGKITYLSCETGNKVYKNTVIAKIIPNPDDLSYKNNVIQLNSLKEQLDNQYKIRNSTIANFESQLKQIQLKKDDLQNQLSTQKNNLGGDINDSGIEKQIALLDETKELLLQNKKQSLKDIDDSLKNIKSNIFNTCTKSLKRLDETFGISEDNKDKNDSFENFLGAKNTNYKKSIEDKIREFLNLGYQYEEKLSNIPNEKLSTGLKEFSELLKNASDVMNDSIPSGSIFTQAQIDGLYNEFIGYSDAIIKFKTNLDSLVNGRETSILSFDSKLKEIEQSKETLSIQKNNLFGSIDSIKIGMENIGEQIKNLEESKNTTIKQIDSQIVSIKEGINKLNVMFQTNVIYAGIDGVVKGKIAKINNSVGIGTPICTIVPNTNSLKLEVYSPEPLDIGDEFEYYKDNKLIGIGKIISEYPIKNNLTQNYIYEGNIDFSNFKEGDYLDIKVKQLLTQHSNEIWIPISYVKPKLDGYYVNKIISGNQLQEIKVEVGNMNNGEILIKSGLQNGDILQ